MFDGTLVEVVVGWDVGESRALGQGRGIGDVVSEMALGQGNSCQEERQGLGVYLPPAAGSDSSVL